MYIFFKKNHQNAIIPTKAHKSDAGFDLSIVSFLKQEGDVYFFDTGIQVCPPKGYYTQIVARSSLCKKGFMLANNIGIIDSDYRGNLIIPLVKINKDQKIWEEKDFPQKIAQLLVCKLEDMQPLEVFSLDQTDRGQNGFGSTDSTNKNNKNN